MDNELHLYLWRDEWRSVLAGGMMVALAHDVEEARRLLLAQADYLPDDDLAREPEVHDAPIAAFVYGG